MTYYCHSSSNPPPATSPPVSDVCILSSESILCGPLHTKPRLLLQPPSPRCTDRAAICSSPRLPQHHAACSQGPQQVTERIQSTARPGAHLRLHCLGVVRLACLLTSLGLSALPVQSGITNVSYGSANDRSAPVLKVLAQRPAHERAL